MGGCSGIFFGTARAQSATPHQMAEYRAKYAAYRSARDRYEAEAGAYWSMIAEKRKLRGARRRNGEAISAEHYVLAQPPVYNGPPQPIDPSAPPQPPAQRRTIPVASDFLANAQSQFAFAPRRPQNELEFKRSYAKVASRLGLTRDQAVRVYCFEAGGNGKYDVQAGLEFSRPNARAISTALGYNQLLTTNTVELLAEQGHAIIEGLNQAMHRAPEPERSALARKIATVRKMIAFSKSVPDEWNAHERIGMTPQGLGIHALNYDVDIGPWLQTYKLLISVEFAKRKGHERPLSAAELEMMNLTGDGNGFDMVSMPQGLRVQVPTSNFFQRGGYERNPVAIRNNTVAKLIAATDARMDSESAKPGAKDLAAAF
ncbi:MAG: hypothetical protein K2W78_02485 [Xanthobacteraceae bacterium]|nr:hypothetical protein [Xanthobacteraceae bacterium]